MRAAFYAQGSEMGAFQGNLTYKLFFVEGELPEDWKDRYLQSIRKFAFEELTPDSEEEEAMGWVSVLRPLQTDFVLNNVLYDDFLCLGLRKDRYTLPSDLLKAHLEELQREFMRKNEKQRLSKFEREDLKTIVKRRLKEQTLPKMKVTDMVWQLSAKRVRYWSQSASQVEVFQEFFEDTFGLNLLPASPYIYALQNDLDDDELTNLATVEPANLVTGSPTIDY